MPGFRSAFRVLFALLGNQARREKFDAVVAAPRF